MSATAATVVYLLFALGAAALFAFLPRGPGSRAMTVGGWLTAAVAGAIALSAARRIPATDGGALFYFFAAVAILCAGRVVTHPRPVYSAVYFVLVVLAVAALLVLQDAEFLAVALVVIYAGAILVTYLFVIMLAQQPGSPVYDRRAREPFGAAILAFVLTGAIAGQIAATGVPASSSTAARNVSERSSSPAPSAEPAGNTAAIGAAVMTRYVVALEVAGVLLLISMVGAIALSRKRSPAQAPYEAVRQLGQIGREVEPF